MGKRQTHSYTPQNVGQDVSPFPADNHKAHINRRTQRHNKHETEKTEIHKRSTPLERSVKYFTSGVKPVSRRQPRLARIHYICGHIAPIVCVWFCVWSLFCYAVLSVLSCIAFILMGKKELVVLL